MSVVQFEYLKVTTMTVVMPLKGMVNLDMVYPLLKITRLDLPVPKRQTQKYKIPYYGIHGAILSARYKGATRGIIKSQTKSHFLNAITIDLSTSVKNVNLKLSKSKMQMCGVNSDKLALEAGQYIIDELYDIQDNIDYLNAHSEEAAKVTEWLKVATKSKQVEFPPGTMDEDQTESIILHGIEIPEKIPDDLDTKIATFLIRQAPDFMVYEDYCLQLDWVLTIKQVISKPLEIIEVNKVMVNYNYDLGFNINRWHLSQLINGLNGFNARYENTVDHSVTIELPYELPTGMKVTRRKDKIPCHTFLVYKSGLVTQSGPNEELMKEAYYIFNNTINQIKDSIMKPGVIRKIKFTPFQEKSSSSSIENSDENSDEANFPLDNSDELISTIQSV